MKMRLLASIASLLTTPLAANEPVMFCERALTAQPIAENTWMVEGLREELSTSNCGHIGNQAFIATPNGTILVEGGITEKVIGVVVGIQNPAYGVGGVLSNQFF